MNQNATDSLAISTAVTAPAWVVILQDINLILATVSLALGIGFAVWRWYRAIKREAENKP